MKLNYVSTATIILFSLLTKLSSAQQDSLLHLYNKEVISYGSVFIKDGQKMKFREVQDLLLKFPNSAAEFSMYKKKTTISRVLLVPAAILLGVAIAEANDETGYVFALGGAGLSIAGSIINRKGHRHLQNSLWLYNREILIQKY